MGVAQQEIEQAKALAQQGNSGAAVAVLSQLIQRDASNVPAWLALSDIVDDPERAEYCLQKVLNLDPGNAAALEKLSMTRGGSLSVGSLGGFNHTDSPSGDDPAPREVPQPASSDETDRPEPVPEPPHVLSKEPGQQDEMPVPESLAEAPSADAAGLGGPQAMEVQFEAAPAAPQNLAETLSTDATESIGSKDSMAHPEAAPAAPEILAGALNTGAVKQGEFQDNEARLEDAAVAPDETAAAAPDEPAQAPAGRSTVARTDLILVGLTVLAAVVLCALVSAALLR